MDSKTTNEGLEQLKDLLAQATKQHPCPSCGHCPTCGRSGYGTYPWYPTPYYPWWQGTTWGGTVTIGAGETTGSTVFLTGTTVVNA